MTVEEALDLLGVKRQTLYAYASRGLLRSVPASEGRSHLYSRADLTRLKARRDARAGHGPVAASALRWGEPVLETAISSIDPRGPIYRGVPAVDLAMSGASFEAAAALLWGEPHEPGERWPPPSPGLPAARLAALLPAGASPISALAVGVPAIGARDAERHLISGASETLLARALILRMAAMLCLPDHRERYARALAETSVARAMLAAFGVRAAGAAIRAVNATLILCADHELNPSTFAVRVAASTGADLYACVSTGLSVLSGPEHGGVCDRVEALLVEAGPAARAAEVVARRARRGEPIPGFGHPIYPAGDPRAAPMLEAASEVAPQNATVAAVRALVKAMAAAGHEPPVVDVGLVAVAAALGLPPGGAAAFYAVGRCAGWIAHAMEQRRAGYIVRPRARYVGPLSLP